tara:strand:- start:571 stop:1521 length:951 start_codon:yes stop_codon:yes gene_type:complete
MKIFISGCAGFIGFHLSRSLLQKGFYIYGIDNLNDYYDIKLKLARLKELEAFKNFSFEAQDLNKIQTQKINFDIAINLAAQAGVRLPKQDYWKYKHSNVDGFKGFLNFCKISNIRKIIYASSSSVYSGIKKVPFKEDSLLNNPLSKYAETKILNEKLAEDFSLNNANNRIIGLRFFTVYGSWGRPDMAYYLFANKIQSDDTITLFNKGEGARDMTHIKDIVDGIFLSIEHLNFSKNKHEIFNLGNNKPISTYDLLERIEKKLNKKSKVIMSDYRNEVMITMADLTKSKTVLGYNPKTDLDSGLDNFFYWYKKYNNV